ncbi:hypothetical protein EJB05_52720, partial [Eragrostis curvula]
MIAQRHRLDDPNLLIKAQMEAIVDEPAEGGHVPKIFAEVVAHNLLSKHFFKMSALCQQSRIEASKPLLMHADT